MLSLQALPLAVESPQRCTRVSTTTKSSPPSFLASNFPGSKVIATRHVAILRYLHGLVTLRYSNGLAFDSFARTLDDDVCGSCCFGSTVWITCIWLHTAITSMSWFSNKSISITIPNIRVVSVSHLTTERCGLLSHELLHPAPNQTSRVYCAQEALQRQKSDVKLIGTCGNMVSCIVMSPLSSK